MSDKVQQAITATRAGQKREAQQLLAEALEENPNNEHAWFLLGNLVDSPEKRKAYLGKVLAINPAYEKARQQYAQVQQQIERSSNWAETPGKGMETAVAEELSAVPDWLTEESADTTAAEVMGDDDMSVTMDMIVDKSEAKSDVATTQKPTKPAKTDREKQIAQYNYLLAFLAILIIVVLVLLVI